MDNAQKRYLKAGKKKPKKENVLLSSHLLHRLQLQTSIDMLDFSQSPKRRRQADVGPADVGPADAGPADAGPADVGPADAGLADVVPADAGPTDAGPADIGPADGCSCALKPSSSWTSVLHKPKIFLQRSSSKRPGVPPQFQLQRLRLRLQLRLQVKVLSFKCVYHSFIHRLPELSRLSVAGRGTGLMVGGCAL